MVKQEYRILVILLLLIAGQLNAQQFDFESDKKYNTSYNQELENALNNNDLKLMKKVLDKEPSLVNSSSKMTTISGNSKLSGGKIPLLYDAVDRCLNEKCSSDMVELILKYQPSLYCTFDNYTPFYLILNYIATHKIDDCRNAENLFNLFCNQSKFDINQKYNDLPPPLSFLLSSNYTYSANSYNREYISSYVIKTFIEKGASINTRDINSTSILTYAVMADENDMVSYCISKRADVTVINNNNHDALYHAVYNNSYKNVSLLLNQNYPLSEKRLAEIDAYTAMPFANEEIKNLLFEKLKNGIKNLESIKVLTKLFPDKKLYFISYNYKRAYLDITTKEIPEFVNLFGDILIYNDPVASMNLNSLKKEYIYSSKNLQEFVDANNICPLFDLSCHSTFYFQDEIKSRCLINELINIKNELPVSLYESLQNEITKTITNYLNKKKFDSEILTNSEFSFVVNSNDSKDFAEYINSSSADALKTWDKVNIFTGGTIKNVGKDSYKVKVSCRVNFRKVTTAFWVFSESKSISSSEMNTLLEIGPGETKPFLFCVSNVSSGYFLKSSGIGQRLILDDPLYVLNLNEYTGTISKDVIDVQDRLLKEFIENGNLKAKKQGFVNSFYGIDYSIINVYYFDKVNDLTFTLYDANNSKISESKSSKTTEGSWEQFFVDDNKTYFIGILDKTYKVSTKQGIVQFYINKDGSTTVEYMKK